MIGKLQARNFNVEQITFYVEAKSEIELVNGSAIKFYKIQMVYPKNQ
jgi:hypothetical protein